MDNTTQTKLALQSAMARVVGDPDPCGKVLPIKMIRLSILAATALNLSACVAAAPLVFTAATTAWTGYNLYSLGTVSKAKYSVDKAELSPAALTEVKAAKSLAVFPTNSRIDGDVVDIFNERSSVPTVSSRTTIAVLESKHLDQAKILSFPAADRAVEISKFGKASGSDLVVFAVLSDTDVSMNPLIARSRASIKVNCKIYSARTGAMLLDEDHTLSFDARDVPNDMDIAKVVSMGVADRLYEIRNGKARKA